MDVFQVRERLVGGHSPLTRSFTRIKTEDIATFVDSGYESQRYWPAPMVHVNPNFKCGRSVEELIGEGGLHPECARIFRAGKSAASAGVFLKLFKHQEEAISFARTGASYVLTTGTSSGKPLAYFIPIVDAIVIYPMNTLTNSQLKELGKLIGDYGDHPPVTFDRYTGQENDEERQRLASNPPEIVLTNFMMLEFLMTRQNDKDKAVIRNAMGLRFLVVLEAWDHEDAGGTMTPMLPYPFSAPKSVVNPLTRRG